MPVNLRPIPHPEAERFDEVRVRTVERWKESELSGDEWRFSYVAEFYFHGQKVAEIGGMSIEDCLLQAAANFRKVEVDAENMKKLEGIFCCQPACTEPWVVLKHPVKRYTKHGDKLESDYDPEQVRGFCLKHLNRGDCDLDDNDNNYIIIDE